MIPKKGEESFFWIFGRFWMIDGLNLPLLVFLWSTDHRCVAAMEYGDIWVCVWHSWFDGCVALKKFFTDTLWQIRMGYPVDGGLIGMFVIIRILR